MVEVTTDPLRLPDLGYNSTPFLGFITLQVKQDLPALGLTAGRRFSISHTGIDAVSFQGQTDGEYDVTIDIGDPYDAAYGIQQVHITEDIIELRGADADVTADVEGECSRSVQFASADVFLEGLIQD